MGSAQSGPVQTLQSNGRRFFQRACSRIVLSGSMPATPYDGMSVWRQDLGEEFVYVAAVTAWLGQRVIPFSGFSNIALTNSYLYFDDLSLPGAATLGYTVPCDCRVIGMSGLIPVASTCTLELRDDGSAVYSLAFAAETRKQTWMASVSSLIAAGSNISFYCNGTSLSAHRADAWLVRSV